MKHTERINRINADIDKHFKSNNGAWWVNNEFCENPGHIILHQGIGGNKIRPVWVALRILRQEPSVQYVHYSYGGMVYTRSTLRRAGYKI